MDLILTDYIETTVDIYDNTMQNLTLGNPYEIQCKVYTDQVVHSDIINITWIGPDNDTVVNDSRIIVTTTNSIGNNHTSTLQFLYLKEGDEGLYTCHVAILSNTDSESFELETILSKLHFTVCSYIAAYTYCTLRLVSILILKFFHSNCM